MITSIRIQNFRSIADMKLDFGKITVLTGANNSGKSSVIYALLVLKNAVTNPNQTLDGILNLGFINLGGIEQTVYKRDQDKNLSVEINSTLNENGAIGYKLDLGPSWLGPAISIEIPSLDIKGAIGISFPYAGNQSIELKPPKIPEGVSIFWNGLAATITRPQYLETTDEYLKRLSQEALSFSMDYQRALNNPNQSIASIDFIPIRRGFTKPIFSPVPLTQQISNEDEIATLIYADRELTSAIAHHLEKIVDRQFSVNPLAGTTNFYLQTRDRSTGFTSDLVNEGLGTNQLITILAKALYKKASFICIDEPEIHLHPSIIDKLVDVLIEIANERNKQFLISTHSEHFINALLNAVVKKSISPDDVKVYHLTKESWDTKAEEQKINIDGQIEGGLANFYAAELANWSDFFKTSEEV